MNKWKREPTNLFGTPSLTRRQVLAGAAGAALAAGIPLARAAETSHQVRAEKRRLEPTDQKLRRYMAASAALPDGRILVTGGYDRPWNGSDKPPTPLRSAMIYDPANQAWTVAAPMATPRARHAAVTLADGRVAVIGGMSQNPTASVEIYDPARNAWQMGASLAQARYDHSAVADGDLVHVLGGSNSMMMSGVETLDPFAPVRAAGRER